MRFYDIQIYDQKGALFRQYSSLKNGVFNPGCLMVECDIQRFGMSTPMGCSLVRIYGISPQEMQQAQQNMFGMTIKMFAGMSKGLPLAKPNQSGLILEGIIQQPFGNWQGTELSLDMIITAGAGSPSEPMNITMPWSARQQLSAAMFFALQRAFPSCRLDINISDRLVNNYESPLFCGSLTQFAKRIKDISLNIIKSNGYSGVEISFLPGNVIRVFDSEQKKKEITPTEIEFTDLIGQPTWIDFGRVMVRCVMRADIQVGDYIRMPERSVAIVQASSYSQYRNQSAFSGVFRVSSVRLIGNSRQPDANSWVAIIEAGIAPEANM